MPTSATLSDKLLCYEDLMAEVDGNVEWEEFDENLGACLCYTSGS